MALAVRVGFVLYDDPPLTYGHQYNYYTNGLRIAEHPDPVAYILRSDRWHAWVGDTTIAPLYHLMLGAFFRLVGPGLLGLRIFQGVLDALVAVAVASLGRRLAGPWGALAGVAYGCYWSAVEMTCWTMTENLHTVLLGGSLALLAQGAEARAGGALRGLLGGVLLGLSGLTRSVSSAFLPLAALWRLSLGGRTGKRRALGPALLIVAGGALAILPWTLRNWFLVGDKVAIETVGFFNLWDDNARGLISPERYDRQLGRIKAQPTPSAAGNTMLLLTARNIARNPVRFLVKMEISFWHFVRPELLANFLYKEYPDVAWRNVGTFLFDDLLLLLVAPPFAAFLLAGAPSPTRRLIVGWTAYYLLMLVVVFHTEARYRSALVPFALAGAAGGVSALFTGTARRRILAWLGLIAGASLSVASSWEYVAAASRALAVARSLPAAQAALDRGDLEAADRAVAAAASLDPPSGRPWRTYGHWLAVRDRAPEAVAAYERAAEAPMACKWPSAVSLPRLLLEAGRLSEAEAATRVADELSWDVDPWLLLETAWRELPAPRTDEILLARGDYGAVRGFHHPRGIDPRLGARSRQWTDYAAQGGPQPPPGPHRWSRGRAWLRLRPLRAAAEHEVCLRMGSPFPSPLSHARVAVRINDGAPAIFTLDPEVRDYCVTARLGPGRSLLVRLDAPTWARAGEPADQAVRVDALRVRPLDTARP